MYARYLVLISIPGDWMPWCIFFCSKQVNVFDWSVRSDDDNVRNRFNQRMDSLLAPVSYANGNLAINIYPDS